MPFVAAQNLLPILVALLIGFVTGLWIWKFARAPRPQERVLTDDEPMRRPYVDKRASNAGDRGQAGGFLGPRPEPEVLARRATAGPGIGGFAANATPETASARGDLPDMRVRAQRADAESMTAAGDDLQTMKGVGPRLAMLLRDEGLTRFDQIASLGPDDLARLDAHLGAFKGRLVRDRIVEQAAFLARGDREGYEREFGRL